MSNHDKTLNSSKNWLKQKILASKKYQNQAFEQINELVFKERNGREITLLNDTKLVEFVSCSYLGLDLDSRVISASTNNLQKCGVTFPAARTRIKAHSFVVLENLLNEIFCQGHSVIFSSLHLAHLGFIPLLGTGEMPSFPIKSDGISFIVDKTVHSSIQINRALMEQFGEVVLIDFQEEALLLASFQKAHKKNKTPIAIADSIGSMGGVASVKSLLHMAEKYQGYIYLDDAHGTSIFGKHGCGYVLDQLDNQCHSRLILTSSLAKAFGAIAGIIVLPTKEDADMVKRFCPTYVFSGPPAIAIIDAAIASANIHLTPEIQVLQKSLWENVAYFDSLMSEHVVNTSMTSPIRGILVGDEFKAIQFSTELKRRGFILTTAMYPVVAKGKSVLRIALSATHSRQQITSLCYTIKAVAEEFNFLL